MMSSRMDCDSIRETRAAAINGLAERYAFQGERMIEFVKNPNGTIGFAIKCDACGTELVDGNGAIVVEDGRIRAYCKRFVRVDCDSGATPWFDISSFLSLLCGRTKSDIGNADHMNRVLNGIVP